MHARCNDFIGLLFWVSAGCADAASAPIGPPATAGSGGTSVGNLPEDPCERAALTRVPNTVTEVVDHLNSLPKPISLACALTSLPRPLALHATRSILSAQPAVGQRSPRVFVFYPELIMSVALAGMGKDLLEFGELRPDARTLKAEIEFPVASELTHAAPFEHVMFQEGQTGCAFCHAAEKRDDSIDFTDAFVSVAYKPSERQARVTVAEMADELARCDAEVEAERCGMLAALFARGLPSEAEFPAEFVTFQ